MIRPEKMTVKTQEALATAQEKALAMSAGTLEPEHLLLALLEQEGGFVPDLLKKIGAPLTQLRENLDASLKRLPKVTGNV
jgi:ATP-dependent Clp protease ATP-binding subunit ClpB